MEPAPITPLPVTSLFRHFLKCENASAMIRSMDSGFAVRALGALAHESRLAIFRALVVAGPPGMAAGRIAGKLRIAPSSLSFHLKDLAHAGLVQSRQEGRFIFYSANFDAMNGLIGFLTENCCEGSACVATAARSTPHGGK